MTTMHYCPECGHELTPEAHFCPECGHDVEHVGVDAATTTRLDTVDSSPAIAPDRVVAQEPAAPAPSVAPASVAPRPTPEPGSDGKLRLIAIVVGALAAVAVVALIVVFLIQPDGGSSDDESSPLGALNAAIEDVDSAQSDVDDALGDLNTSAASITAVGTSGDDLADALADAVDASKSARADLSADERAALDDVDAALDAHDAYASALSSLDAPSDVTDDAAGDIEDAADEAATAWSDAGDAVDTAGLDLAVVEIDVDAAAEVADVADELQATAARTAAANRRKAETRAFLLRIENLIEQSGNGRADIVEAISATDNGCTMDPSVAATQVSQVARNRQSLLDQLNAMSVPATSAARTIHDELQMGLQASIQADIHFADWMTTVANYYYMPPQGCPNGQPPHDENYAQAESDSGEATTHKQRFVAAYNRAAKSYGLRADWSANEI